MSDLDQIDLKLLKLLQQSGKLTTKEIAQQVNLSSTSVYERIKRLEMEGRYPILIDSYSVQNYLLNKYLILNSFKLF